MKTVMIWCELNTNKKSDAMSGELGKMVGCREFYMARHYSLLIVGMNECQPVLFYNNAPTTIMSTPHQLPIQLVTTLGIRILEDWKYPIPLLIRSFEEPKRQGRDKESRNERLVIQDLHKDKTQNN